MQYVALHCARLGHGVVFGLAADAFAPAIPADVVGEELDQQLCTKEDGALIDPDPEQAHIKSIPYAANIVDSLRRRFPEAWSISRDQIVDDDGSDLVGTRVTRHTQSTLEHALFLLKTNACALKSPTHKSFFQYKSVDV